MVSCVSFDEREMDRIVDMWLVAANIFRFYEFYSPFTSAAHIFFSSIMRSVVTKVAFASALLRHHQWERTLKWNACRLHIVLYVGTQLLGKVNDFRFP